MDCSCGVNPIPAGGKKVRGGFPSSSAGSPAVGPMLSGRFCTKCFGFWAIVALAVIIFIAVSES
jgi:hypothetical protein